MKMTTTTGTTSHPKNPFGMGGKTGPAVVEVTTKEGAGPGVYVTETDSSGWLKKGRKAAKWFRGLGRGQLFMIKKQYWMENNDKGNDHSLIDTDT